MVDKYMVIKSTRRDIAGLSIEGKDMTFGKKTHAFEVNDSGLAREIEAQHGPKATGDVVVMPHVIQREPGHRYTFTVPELPWKRNNGSD